MDGSPPPMGHNSMVEVDEGKFLEYVSILGDLGDQKDAIAKKIKTVRKKARADGIRLTALDEALKYVEMERGEPQTHIANVAQYMEWLKKPLGFQGTLFESEDDDPYDGSDGDAEKRAVQDAEFAGFNAGLNGKPDSENPYEGNTPAGQAWIKSHREGLARRPKDDGAFFEDDDD